MIIRKAKISDVAAIHALITNYADEGLMLARPLSKLYENIREFSVAEADGKIIGAGALHIIWEDLAEIRALAVDPQNKGNNVGRTLVKLFLKEAKDLGIPMVFTLTYQPGFFEKCGFHTVTKDKLPHKVWRECIDCPKFPNCEESALVAEVS